MRAPGRIPSASTSAWKKGDEIEIVAWINYLTMIDSFFIIIIFGLFMRSQRLASGGLVG